MPDYFGFQALPLVFPLPFAPFPLPFPAFGEGDSSGDVSPLPPLPPL
eukprot:CAMPEP_0179279052 /NCGR_PEP_ID=MMETSP0797-20121207/35917_1 /TAXON_ID=47934 /ORGANISM="Dinophysis acuminata, Strain DAEP01" /LENGTH=46 /DNA_ID= /DNA_START= /DNA_END= /DNA_ORIENTATION=